MNTGFHFEEGVDLFMVDMRDAPVILALMAAAIAAEVFLALKKDGRLGLVLPGLWLLKSVVQLMIRVVQVSGYSSVSSMWGALGLALLVDNIPTLLLLAAYGLCRVCERRRIKRQMDKTRIEDL